MGCQKDIEFEKYYTKYYPQVYGYIYKKVINEHLAEDLTMDVFYSCWSKYDSFDESKASFQTWLYVVVNNKLKNYYRDRKVAVDFDDALMYDHDHSDDVIEAIQLQELREHLYVALEALNESQRSIVVYKYFKNMNSSDIASVMGLTSGNVRIQLKRALEKIKDYFDKKNIRWE